MRKLLSTLFLFLFLSNLSFGQSEWKFIAPLPFQNPITKIVFIGNNSLIGIAGNNTIYRSSNNGNNWSSQKVNFNDIYGVANIYFFDNYTGWIVSDLGKIFKTTNAGLNWFSQESYTNFALKNIKFINHQTGYITGNGGTVLKSTDGGNNWYFRGIKNISHQFSSLEIINPETIIVSGVTGPGPATQIMLKTTNSGNSWFNISTGQRLYYSLLKTDKSNLMCLGQDGIYWGELKTSIYISTNEGSNWNRVFLDTTIEAISLSKKNNEIWLLGNKIISYSERKMIILKSTNGGYNWNFVSQSNFGIPINYNNNINFEDNGSLSIYWRYSIIKSNDNGTNWMFKSRDELSSTYDIKFLNHNIGFSKLYDKVLRTSNGGINWDTLNIPNNKLGKFEFIDEKVFFTRWDTVNNLYKSINRGLDFNSINIGNLKPYLINYNSGKLRITFNETVNKINRAGLLTSTNEGLSFTKNYFDNQIQGELREMNFFENTGYIITSYKVYKSTDYGNNWEGIFSLRDNQIYKSGILNENFIWLVGYNKKIYKSINGGIEWDSLVSISGLNINQISYDIEFTSPTNCFISAISNLNSSNEYLPMIFTSTNSGLNWDYEFFDITFNRLISPTLYMFNNESGYMVFSSTILGKNILTNINSNQQNIEVKDFTLHQNFPNPFNPETKIKFNIFNKSKISLKVYDVSGKLISILVNDNLNEGFYEVEFNGRNFSSGVYFYVLSSNQKTISKKMLLIK